MFTEIAPTDEHAPIKKNKESRKWLVVQDPSGDFLGALFRYMDLKFGLGNWPEGITFQHISTGQRMTWDSGQFVTLQSKRR